MTEKRKVIPIADETLSLFDAAIEMATNQRVERPFAVPAGLRIGTSAFTATGWEGSFYPDRMKPAQYLSYYSTQFNSVEVDSTFYRTPSASTVNAWYEKTPPDFVFAAKVPQVITHEKVLLDCDAEFEEFIDRDGPAGRQTRAAAVAISLFQQPSLQIRGRVLLTAALLPSEDQGHNLPVRRRDPEYLLREYNVALALQDQSWHAAAIQVQV